MKKYLLLILLFPAITFSQYEFIPSDDATWTGRWLTWCGGPNCIFQGWIQCYTDTINGDTLIGSYNYKRFIARDGWLNEFYIAAYRSDSVTKSIYLVDKDSTNEVLFFDFDATYAVGDTVWIPHYMLHLPTDPDLALAQFILTDINTVSINLNPYTSYYFNLIGNVIGSATPANSINITERMINRTSFPFFGDNYFETMNELRCYQEAGVNLYGQCPYPLFTDDVSVGENELNASVYPNPVENILKITVSDNELTTIIIYDQAGREIVSETFVNEIILDIEMLDNSSLYYYRLESATRLESGKFIKK